MKKKIFSIITLLIMCVLWVNAQQEFSYIDQTQDVTFTYTLDGSGNATIIRVELGDDDEFDGTVTIQNTIEGHTIVGISSWYDQGNNPHPAFPNGVVTADLPSTITKIGEKSFQNCSTLETVKFAKNEVALTGGYKQNCALTTIGDNAFEDCIKLATFGVKNDDNSYYFPSAVATIGNSAFKNCYYLTIGYDKSGTYNWGLPLPFLTTLGNGAFYNCTSLNCETIVAAMGALQRIPDDCFRGCTSLETIELSGITTIGSYAFYDCTKLNKIIIFNNSIQYYNITSIGEYAFYGCSALTNVPLSTTTGSTIGKYAFKNCSNLKSINSDNKLTSIGYGSFENCNSLNDINLDNVNEIKDDAFKSCIGIKKIHLPAVSSIGANAFDGCTDLDTFICDNVNSLGTSGFLNCSSLKYVKFGKNCTIEKLDENVFKGCSKLNKIILPTNLKIINSYAFFSCTGLKSIHIPSSVDSIAVYAFDQLEEIFFDNNDASQLKLGGVPTLNPRSGQVSYSKPFPTNAFIYIPLNSYDSYFNNSYETRLYCIQATDEFKNPTWEYSPKETVSTQLNLCKKIPTRIDTLTVDMSSKTIDYFDKNDNQRFVVWDTICIKRTIDDSKYYYMSIPFDVNPNGTEWGKQSADSTLFQVFNGDEDVTNDYFDTDPEADNGVINDNNHKSYYIYKFSSKLFSEGNYNDAAFEYVNKNSKFLKGNAYAIGVDDSHHTNGLTFMFSKNVTGRHYEPYSAVTIETDPRENVTPISHTNGETTLNNWIMLANPYFSPIGISSTNYTDIFSGIKYAYAFGVNKNGYNPVSPDSEAKAYKLEAKDFEDGVGDDGVVNAYPHNPIYVQVESGTKNITMGFKSVETQGAQQIPAAAPRHSKIIDLALIADGEQLDHTEIKDNPTGADEYVIGEDFYKMFNSGFDEIYTMIGDSVECFANELNLQTSNRVVPLAFHIYNAGDFTLSLKNKANILDYKVYLRNLTDNSVTDLLVNDPTLHLGEGISEGDYQIEIDYAPTAVSAVENDGNSKVYVLADGLLHIDNLGSSVVSLYDATGKLLSVTDPHSDNLELTLPARGIYFVNLRGSENSTVKVVY